MGLGKNLGLGKKGKIHVNTEKPTYYPGEVQFCIIIIITYF